MNKINVVKNKDSNMLMKLFFPFLVAVLWTPVTLFVGLFTYVFAAIIDTEGLPAFIAIPLLGVVSFYVVLKYRAEYIALRLKNQDTKLDLIAKEKAIIREDNKVELEKCKETNQSLLKELEQLKSN